MNRKTRKAVFLDRDGTIMKDKGYLNKVSGIEFYKDTVSALKKLQGLGYLLFGVSNQSGIARGLIMRKKAVEINKKVILLLKNRGVRINKIYFCPHITEDLCSCRKPNTGMIKQAAEEYNVDLKHSVVIGDKLSDVALGKNARMLPILLFTGRGRREFAKTRGRYFLTAANLSRAAKLIEDRQ